MTEQIERTCSVWWESTHREIPTQSSSESAVDSDSVCGDNLSITLYDDSTYDGGYYWSKLFDDDIEYWECPECWKDDDGHDESVPP